MLIQPSWGMGKKFALLHVCVFRPVETSSLGTWMGATTSTASSWGECVSFILAHFLLRSLPFSASRYILSDT